MKPAFHLSLPVRSLDESVEFFVRVLRSNVEHVDPSGYVNLDFFGSQITLKQNAAAAPRGGDFHFGVNLDLEALDALAAHVQATAPASIVGPLTVVDAGTPLERKKMYLKCPTGHLIELKGYKA